MIKKMHEPGTPEQKEFALFLKRTLSQNYMDVISILFMSPGAKVDEIATRTNLSEDVVLAILEDLERHGCANVTVDN